MNRIPGKRDLKGGGPQRLALLACIALAGFLVTAGMDVAEPPEAGLPPVDENLDAAQVDQPVTAVLLNFRGYDTWLEVGVLVVVVLGLLALHRTLGLDYPREERSDPVLDIVTRLLVPFMVLIGGFLLWAGTRIPGGAFQAGALLGSAGVLLRVAGVGPWFGRLMTGLPLRMMALFGFALFLVVAAGTVLAGRQFLEYPPDLAGPLIFVLEAAITISIGWTLAFLYLAAAPPQTSGPQDDDAP